MSINNIHLNPSMLAALYPNSLVQGNDIPEAAVELTPPSPSAPPEGKNKTDWISLGNNKQLTMIVVDYAGVTHIPDDALAFLTKMLGACKLSLADVCIINRQNYPGTAGRDIIQHFRSRSVLLFNVTPEIFDLPVSFPEFQVQPVAGTTYLHAPSLETMQQNDQLKQRLWSGLKRIFSL